MGVIIELFVDVARIAMGLTPFSWLLWAYVTLLLLVVGPVFVQVAPRIVDPPARLLATDPLRVAVWMPLSVVAFFIATVALFVTIFGAMLVPILGFFLLAAGYLAIGRLVGERLIGSVRSGDVQPWVAALVGLALVRVVRVVPYVGGAAHSMIAWLAFASASCVAVRAARSWWRRRLPDHVQFRGETLVEWYPDGDPEDGKPSVGSGRPVVDNVRGDEDRTT